MISSDDLDRMRSAYREGATLLGDVTELRNATSVEQWRDILRDRETALAPRIVPGKSDVELAQEYRQRALELLEPFTALMNEARSKGLMIGFQYGVVDAFGRQSLAVLEVTKKLA